MLMEQESKHFISGGRLDGLQYKDSLVVAHGVPEKGSL